jgi:outer membrane protein
MKMKNYVIVLCMWILVGSVSLTAITEDELKQVHNDGKILLTVEKCVEIGLVYSKSYYSSLMDVQIADAKFKETRTKQLPSLKLTGSYTRLSNIPPFRVDFELPGLPAMHFVISDTILNSYNFQLTLQQPLFTGFAVENAVKASRLGSKAAKELYSRDRNELIYNIKNAYWSLYKAIEFKKLIDENVQLIDAHYKDIQRFFDQGLAKLNDVMKIRVQLSSMKVSQLETNQNVRLAMMSLNSLLGISLDKEIEPVSKIEAASETLGDVPAEVAKALAKRSEIKAMGYNLEAAKAAIKIARSGYFPQLALVADYYYSNPNTRIMPVEKKFKDTWDLSLGLSYDVWNWKSTAYQVAQANSQFLKAKAGESQLKDMITLEVQQNYFDLLQAKEKIDMSEESVKQAEENYRITHERFKAGLTTNSELLDAEVALLNTKVSRTEAFIDYMLAKARFHKSIGEEQRLNAGASI